MVITDEIWRPWPLNTDYEVSSRGAVRGIKRNRPLTLRVLPTGYMAVSVRHGKKTYQQVHAMVLQTFVGPRPAGMVTRHLNGVRSDNRIENLAWGTHMENVADRAAHGTENVGERNGRAKITRAMAQEIRSLVGLRHKDIGAIYGLNRSTVSSLLRGETWK